MKSMPCRWYEKRIKGYIRIFCNFDDATMLQRTSCINKRTSHDVLPPLLPSLLATCASSAEMALNVMMGQGKPAVTTSLHAVHKIVLRQLVVLTCIL